MTHRLSSELRGDEDGLALIQKCACGEFFISYNLDSVTPHISKEKIQQMIDDGSLPETNEFNAHVLTAGSRDRISKFTAASKIETKGEN